MNKTYDFVVIGGGSAGYAAARAAVTLGLTVAVVEGGREVGGLCILGGCMPSKTLIESANRFITLRRAREFGLRAGEISIRPDEIIARKKNLVGCFADHRRCQLEHGGFDFIRGMAALVDGHTVEIKLIEGGVTRIGSRSFLIATGSVENCVHVPGLAEAGVLDSDAVLAKADVPESIVILGGGAIAMEFAHYYAGLGTEVTIIQRSGQVLKDMDEDVAGALMGAYQKRGMKVFLDTALLRIERSGDKKRVVFKHSGVEQSVEAREILCALGRKPRLEGLEVERAGIRVENGRLVCNATQQTSVPHIFAAGDVETSHEVVHVAVQQGEVVARNAAKILRSNSAPLEEISSRLKLSIIFSEPEVAAVGSTEKELRRDNIPYLAAKYPFDDQGKAIVMGETEGFVKLIAAKDSREILGGAVVGPHASDLIHEIVAAMYFHAKAGDIAMIPHYHPTLSEIWTYPAEELASA